MAGRIVYECPVCQTEKRDVNHWYLVWPMSLIGEPEFCVRPWDDDIAQNDPDVLTVCGSAHVHRLLGQFLTERESVSATARQATLSLVGQQEQAAPETPAAPENPLRHERKPLEFAGPFSPQAPAGTGIQPSPPAFQERQEPPASQDSAQPAAPAATENGMEGLT